MKRTTVMCLVVLLGIGCGYAGVWVGESLPYPEAPVLVDGDAIRAAMIDATLLNTQAWLLKNLVLDQEVTRIELKLEADETTND